MGMKHTSATMKKHIAETKTGIIWRGRHITDPKDVPTDEEIKQADEEHVKQILLRR